jgi:adenine-specific DNA-methyltransferase
MAGEVETRFIALMSELLQLREAEELDFGIYRLIRRHNRRMREFLGVDEAGVRIAGGGEIDRIFDTAFAQIADAAVRQMQQTLATLGAAIGVPTHPGSQADVDGKLAEVEKIPAMRPQVEEYRTIRANLLAAHTATDDRVEALNRLYEFYDRHYQDGDFIVQRRYNQGGARYVKSTGEDTEFHWATQDMYYIKSGDVFTDYPVRLSNGKTLTFSVEADTLAKTRKELKPNDKASYKLKNIQGDALGWRVTLEYHKGTKSKAKQEEAIRTATSTKTRTQPEEIGRHLRRYMARNQADFFIHRRLREALDEDLDIFIKTEVLNADQLLASGEGTLAHRAIRLARAVREIGQRLNAFLGVLEDHQKRLWEKKKLVLDTRYIISLDRLHRYAPDWLKANEASIVQHQRKEWEDLGLGKYAKAADCRRQVAGDLATAEKTRYLPLPVDTANFDADFKWSLLAQVSATLPLDEAVDGVAIQSDNWQALNTLQEKYRGQVKCTYIDPPYNTGGDGFPYKDAFKHSSWIAMISNRLELARNLMPPSSALYASIDENERDSLTQALNTAFGERNRAEEIIWGQNTTKNQSPTFSTNHEYIPVYARSLEAAKADKMMFRESKPGAGDVLELVEKMNPTYPPIAEIEKAIADFYKSHVEEFKAESEEAGNEYDSKLDPWKGLYNYKYAEYRDADGRYVPEDEARAKGAKIWVWQEDNPSMPKGGGTDNKPGVHTLGDPDFRFYTPLHPVTRIPCPCPKTGWRWPEKPIGLNSSFEEMQSDHRVYFGDGQPIKFDRKTKKPIYKTPRAKKFLHEVDTQVAQSVVLDYTDGEKELTDLFGKTRSFPNPKPTTLISRFVSQASGDGDWVMDFFSGSGTTWQAVANTCRDERVKRKTLLVEGGTHFEDILLKRIKKVAFSLKWKSGAPETRNGPGVFLRVQHLEQYDDTLENLATTAGESGDLFTGAEALAYDLDTEAHRVLVAGDRFSRPFGMTLRRAADAEVIETPVDLVESLVYLLGVHVARLYLEQGSVVLTGRLNDRDERVTVLWRDNALHDAEWIQSKMRAHPAERYFTNSPEGLAFEGVERFESIEAVFVAQLGGTQ